MITVARRRQDRRALSPGAHFAAMNDRHLSQLSRVTTLAEQVEAALKPQPKPEPVRTLADMTPNEKRAIEKHYGVRLCETLHRRRR